MQFSLVGYSLRMNPFAKIRLFPFSSHFDVFFLWVLKANKGVV